VNDLVVGAEHALGGLDHGVEAQLLVRLGERRRERPGALAEPRPMLGPDRRRHGADVPALISIDGERHGLAAELEIAQPRRQGEDVHLPPEIVDVELAGDIEARGGEHVGEACAVGRAAAVSHMQWAGRIRRDELDLDFLALAARPGAVACAGFQDAIDDLLLERPFEKKIDEARSRHLGSLDVGRCGQGRHEAGGNFTRRALE